MVMRFERAGARGSVSRAPRSNVDDGKIFKVDTVPPPAGESDAYNAPTRVGSLDAAEWQVLMDAAESRGHVEPASRHDRGELAPVSERGARAPEPRLQTSEIPPPPPSTVPCLDDDDDDDDDELAWSALGAAARAAVEEVRRASAPVPSTPPPRPSAFPEWVAGTNVQEQAAHEEVARRRRARRTLLGVCVAVTLALGGLVAAVIRN